MFEQKYYSCLVLLSHEYVKLLNPPAMTCLCDAGTGSVYRLSLIVHTYVIF